MFFHRWSDGRDFNDLMTQWFGVCAPQRSATPTTLPGIMIHDLRTLLDWPQLALVAAVTWLRSTLLSCRLFPLTLYSWWIGGWRTRGIRRMTGQFLSQQAVLFFKTRQLLFDIDNSLDNLFTALNHREDEPLDRLRSLFPIGIRYFQEWTFPRFTLHRQRLSNVCS